MNLYIMNRITVYSDHEVLNLIYLLLIVKCEIDLWYYRLGDYMRRKNYLLPFHIFKIINVRQLKPFNFIP